MSVKTIGLVSPGDIGYVVGKILQSHGLRVLTCLKGRSERTHMLAREAQIDAVPSYEGLVAEAEMVLSIVVPEAALDTARLMAEALRRTGRASTFVDCNAVAPGAVKATAEVIAASAAVSSAPLLSGHRRGKPASPVSMPQDLSSSPSSNSTTSASISGRWGRMSASATGSKCVMRRSPNSSSSLRPTFLSAFLRFVSMPALLPCGAPCPEGRDFTPDQ